MKAKQLKRIVDFISQHHADQSSQSIRALLKHAPEQFIDLLNEAVDKTETVPSSVLNFITEVSKQVQETKSPEQSSPTKENQTMENQKKASFIMRLVNTAKSAWVKAIQLLTSNTGKVKLAVSAAAVAVIAIMTSKGTAILSVLAALKSRGFVQYVMDVFTKGLFSGPIGLAKQVKSAVKDKSAALFNIAKAGGLVVISKLNDMKNFIVSKAKQAWSWLSELFTAENDVHTYQQAA